MVDEDIVVYSGVSINEDIVDISGLWLITEHQLGGEFEYELTLHTGGRVSGRGGLPKNAQWVTALQGSLKGDRLEWIEFRDGVEAG